MKNLVLSLFLVSLFQLDNAHATQATVIDEFGCSILASDSGLPINLYTTDTHAVITPSGNTLLKCHFDIPAEYIPTNTMRHSGFPCGTYLGLTTDSFSVTTRGGKVMLDCKVKAN